MKKEPQNAADRLHLLSRSEVYLNAAASGNLSAVEIRTWVLVGNKSLPRDVIANQQSNER